MDRLSDSEAVELADHDEVVQLREHGQRQVDEDADLTDDNQLVVEHDEALRLDRGRARVRLQLADDLLDVIGDELRALLLRGVRALEVFALQLRVFALVVAQRAHHLRDVVRVADGVPAEHLLVVVVEEEPRRGDSERGEQHGRGEQRVELRDGSARDQRVEKHAQHAQRAQRNHRDAGARAPALLDVGGAVDLEAERDERQRVQAELHALRDSDLLYSVLLAQLRILLVQGVVRLVKRLLRLLLHRSSPSSS